MIDRMSCLLNVMSSEYNFVLGEELIEQVKHFQALLMKKERYLAHHIRVNITMCYDAMATSPVESMNDVTKNTTMRIGANMNLSTSVVALVKQHSARYEQHVNKMLFKMDSTNLPSNASTKQHIHHKCQAMIDIFREKSKRNYTVFSGMSVNGCVGMSSIPTS